MLLPVAGDRSTVTGFTAPFSTSHSLVYSTDSCARVSLRDSFLVFFAHTKMLGRTGARTRERMYSGNSPYGHLTSKKTSQLQSPWFSPKLYSTVQITPCNKVTSPLRSLLPSPVGDLNSEVPVYCQSIRTV